MVREGSVSGEEQRFPVRLTAAQRKLIAGLIPGLTDRLKLDEKNQRVIPLTHAEIQDVRTRVQREFRQTRNGMERASLRLIPDALSQALEAESGIGAIPAVQRVYQFKITLQEIRPPIWRRIQVKNGTLDRLHEHIQTAMGWTNSHLHEFEIDGRHYGDPWLLEENIEEMEYEDSTVVKLSEIVPKSGKRLSFLYVYDFGDNWRHDVVFEGCTRAEPGTRYPLCLEGGRHCPPEDVGSVPGYEEFVRAITGRNKKRREELLEWSGPFDPEHFDAIEATRRMRRGLPDWRKDYA